MGKTPAKSARPEAAAIAAASMVPPELVTVHDWLRYAVSRYRAADLHFGHGAASALDEAAYLILTTLSLPLDAIDPWLPAQLTAAEKDKIAALIEARVTTRKPVAYLTGEAFIGPHRFFVDERTIVPRSFIGELLVRDMAADGGVEVLGLDVGSVTRVLDLCTGGGSLAILAALAFPDAMVDAVDLSADALAVATTNVAAYDLADRVRLLSGDLFAPLGGERYDLILSNPPYVDAAAMADLPPEYRHEPVLALAGGDDGLDLVHRILAGAAKHLGADGVLIVEIGRGRSMLEAARPDLPLIWLDTDESSGEVFQLEARHLASSAASKPRRPPPGRTPR